MFLGGGSSSSPSAASPCVAPAVREVDRRWPLSDADRPRDEGEGGPTDPSAAMVFALKFARSWSGPRRARVSSAAPTDGPAVEARAADAEADEAGAGAAHEGDAGVRVAMSAAARAKRGGGSRASTEHNRDGMQRTRS